MKFAGINPLTQNKKHYSKLSNCGGATPIYFGFFFKKIIK